MNFQLYSIFIIFSLHTSDVLGNHRFGYSRPDQRRWSKHHGHCSGKMQSPISITSSKAIPLVMPAIEMIGYHNLLPNPLKIHNNGHTIILHVAKLHNNEVEMGDFLPYIRGGKLDGEYELESLHFHWGDKNSRGAEHMINDIRYAMEMHIVHRNKKYQSLTEALGYSDGVAVMGFFFALQENEGEELHNIVKHLHLVPDADTTVAMNATFSLSSLIGNIDLDRFYTYKGSLTTPPCSEAVTWILFPEPLEISTSQISKFRHLHGPSEGQILVDNYRSLQPLGNRRVFLRKVNIKYTPNSLFENDVHYSKWDWLY